MSDINKPDKELNEQQNSHVEHFVTVGKRLLELRTQLKISKKNLDAELGFAARTVERFEYGSGGNPKSLIALLLYYVEKGYNLNWILLEDNSNLFKREKNITVNIDLGMAETYVDEINENAKALKKIFNKIV